MIIRKSESRQQTVRSNTIDGLNLDIYLSAAAVNTAIGVNDFDPRQVNLKVLLKRNKRTYTLMQDNLLILGTFNSLLKGHHEFQNGWYVIAPAANAKAVQIRTVKICLGGHVNLKNDDEIFVEVTIGSGAFSANLDDTNCYVECDVNYSIGYEGGVMYTVSEVIQANSSKQAFNPGDNVVSLALLNFSEDNFVNQVVTNLQFSSDRLDFSHNFFQLLNRHVQQFGCNPNYRYGHTIPIDESNPSDKAFKWLPVYPQSFQLLHEEEVDKLVVDISFNGSLVQASQNYLVYRRYETDIVTVAKAQQMDVKHTKEKLDKLPAQMN
jgi:hypothetical protein